MRLMLLKNYMKTQKPYCIVNLKIVLNQRTFMKNFSDSIKYIGVDDTDIDLFEGQYIVPEGMAYNSYVILDEKIAVMDAVDARKANEWLENLDKTLNGRNPDYLVIQHLEPDHSGGILAFIQKYPNSTIVASTKAIAMLPQFFPEAEKINKQAVKEGEKIELGNHVLQFINAPMIHWPEVIFTYESSEKILFSADAFGKFGVYDARPDDWACEARRYYFNIVGKYGTPVQNVLKKLSSFSIEKICPLHGPVLTENLDYYIGKYITWSNYAPEDSGVLIAFASIYGNTKKAALFLEEKLKQAGVEKIVLSDLARSDMAEVIEDAFRYDRMILMAPTYDAGLFPVMESFLHHLKAKNYCNRKIGLVENGSWAPVAAKKMQEIITEMKNISLAEKTVTILSTLNETTEKELENLAKEMSVSS